MAFQIGCILVPPVFRLTYIGNVIIYILLAKGIKCQLFIKLLI